MKKIIILYFVIVCNAFASNNCFIAKENDQIITEEGNCTIRYSPCSSFKIALSIMGYDSKILKDETHPVWPYKKEYEAYKESWKDLQNPTTWMKNSCVWYSQILTPKLSIKKFKRYVEKFDYGNQDVSGDVNQNNGLTNSWLSSSLEISPIEQIIFLEKLLDYKLPASIYAQNMTKNILYVEDLANGWKLYGKTGSGYLISEDRKTKLEIKHGWFIGWIEKNNRKIIFANHIIDDKKEETHAGPRAKEQALQKISSMINEFEK